MEYTVQKLSKIACISTRTLRYYDEIGILKPARINSSGYRIYGDTEVNRLQQILFYRELGVSLDSIKNIVTSHSFNGSAALREHRERLLEKRQQIDLLIANVNKTIALTEGRIDMKDKEKFEGFKEKMLEENEKNYGKEIRVKYGEEAVNKANDRFKDMSQQQNEEVKKLEERFKTTLAEAFDNGNPSSAIAQKAADIHKQWLSFYWNEYSKEAHAGLAKMYVDDERFKAYYDEKQPGTAEFLKDAILIYTGIKK